MKPFLVIIFLSFGLAVFSQNEINKEPTGKQLEIGVDATSFVENFISFGSSVNALNPYTFHLKLIKKNKGLRIHAGFNAGAAQSETNGFTETSSFTSNLKVGYEKRTLISKRWMALYGVDALVNYAFSNNLSIDFEQVTIKSQQIGAGLKPFIGFAFNITPKIYLSTEAGLEALYSIMFNETVFVDLPISNQKDESNLFRISTVLPTNLNFTIKF